MTLDEFLSPYTFDFDVSTKNLTIKIDTSANFGYFKGKNLGDDTWGILTFNDKQLVDYEETICLPKEVVKALSKKGFTLSEDRNPFLC